MKTSKQLNLTAYKVLKLFLVLNTGPASLEAIQAQFAADPIIASSPSQDSVGLYLNALRRAGCQILRPASSNHFQYLLTHHPFTYRLNPTHLKTLQLLRRKIHGRVNTQAYFQLNRWIAHVLENSLELTEGDKYAVLGHLLYANWSEIEMHLNALDHAIRNKTALSIHYQVPKYAPTRYDIFPSKLHYQRQNFHLICQDSQNGKHLSLRLDRIISITRSEKIPTVTIPDAIRLRFPNCLLEDYTRLGPERLTQDGQDLIVHYPLAVQANARHDAISDISTVSEFQVFQHVLSLAKKVHVLSPLSFKERLSDEIAALKKQYHDIQAPVL